MRISREMVEELTAMVPKRTILVLGDNAYTNRYLMKDLPENVHFIGHVRLNAAVYGEPDKSPTRARSGRGDGGR